MMPLSHRLREEARLADEKFHRDEEERLRQEAERLRLEVPVVSALFTLCVCARACVRA